MQNFLVLNLVVRKIAARFKNMMTAYEKYTPRLLARYILYYMNLGRTVTTK